MLSILIPTYNYNVYPLVCKLEQQAINSKCVFEIICFDDGSKSLLNIENKKINTLKNSKFIELKDNIGRSKIRNLLASEANFDWLLFLDSDTMPISDSFIKTYLNAINNQTKIIYGGILYKENSPSDNHMLRWTYGKNREALSKTQRDKNPYLRFLTLNFLIHKSVFKKVSFNEKIPNLRHEDTLFASELKREIINIVHLENPEASERLLPRSREPHVGQWNRLDQGVV